MLIIYRDRIWSCWPISSTEAWSVKERSSTGFAADSKDESETVQLWALDISRMSGVAGLPGSMPQETRRRIRCKISAVHQDMDAQLECTGAEVISMLRGLLPNGCQNFGQPRLS